MKINLDDEKAAIGLAKKINLERELINNSKAELFDKAIKHVQNNYCETYIDIPYLLIGDVAELIKITTGKEVDLETLTKNK